eukprot:CAMPEP_0114173008 /NCGR_PEP_ID=MMETSP0043_2-20121206/35598_1 /TAXON_ID=464988 /ORGANISM="Hemiselmis andersenii, Strain CCMP644" /LENGTH=81 /DNA_ID=CAMNT_0001270959 /DNA_START=59 /DNA_END=304 /DNA_ORIENTATION=+
MVLCSAAATSTVARRMAMNMPQRQDSNDAEAGNEQDPANGCLTELCHPAYVLQELDTDKEQHTIAKRQHQSHCLVEPSANA